MATNESPNQFEFQGFQSPNTTQVPDELFDKLLTVLSHSELKVLLYIIRRTFGFKKDSDNISLSQMLHGITTKDGRILDRGAGLSKPSLLLALRELQKKKIIITERRRSIEKGNEPTAYKLRFTAYDQEQSRENPPPLVKIFGQGVGEENYPRARAKKLTIQQTVLQETVEQHDVVVAQLQKFGVSEKAATQLAKTYPESYIRDKLEFIEYLTSTGSPLVKKNPAGFLRRAIEEDYEPPTDFETTNQRQTREARQQKTAQTATEQRRRTEEEFRLAREQAKQHLLDQHPPQPVGEDGLNTQSAWNLTLDKLQSEVPKPTFETWLKDTLLLNVAGNTAHVMVPSTFAGEWLERRMYQSIARTLGNVLQQEVGVEFVAAQPAS